MGVPQVEMLGERRAIVRCTIGVNGRRHDNLYIHLLDITTGLRRLHLSANEEIEAPEESPVSAT